MQEHQGRARRGSAHQQARAANAFFNVLKEEGLKEKVTAARGKRELGHGCLGRGTKGRCRFSRGPEGKVCLLPACP